jgi:hypothetical protein
MVSGDGRIGQNRSAMIVVSCNPEVTHAFTPSQTFKPEHVTLSKKALVAILSVVLTTCVVCIGALVVNRVRNGPVVAPAMNEQPEALMSIAVDHQRLIE